MLYARAMVRSVLVGSIAAVMLAGCGSAARKPASACENVSGRRVCSKPGCITTIATGRERCGAVAVAYCEAAKAAYAVAVRAGDTTDAARARRACLRVHVDLR